MERKPGGTIKIKASIEGVRHVWVVTQCPGEALDSWFNRTVAIRNGTATLSAEQCADFECNGDMIHLCIPCMPSETEAQCKQRLRDAVELYKQIAGC